MKLSPNFSLNELTASSKASSIGISNEPSEAALGCLKSLVEALLQPMRSLLGKPFKISSGYRSPELNEAIGGAKNSQHTLGQAVDFTVQGMSVIDACKCIIVSGLEFDQLIYEGAWIHLSYSKGNNRNQVLTAVFTKGKPTEYIQGLKS